MASYQPSSSSVFQHFFAPVIDVFAHSTNQYDCKTLSDLDYLEMGIMRCLSESTTGRDFIQRHGDHQRLDIDLNLFFKSLKSKRRLKNISSVNDLLRKSVGNAVKDPYADIPELDKFEVFSGDGHFHDGAVHDARINTSKGGRRKPATGHFFMIDQRSHYMSHLCSAHDPEEVNSKKMHKMHDMKALKACSFDQLRGHAPKGTKVILVWDKAGADFKFWHKAKRQSGLYFISREKKSMTLIVDKELEFDRTDPRNKGVISDEKTEPSSMEVPVRRIVYIDPETGKSFKFITTEMTLPPGIICLLYKQRWDIEKVFDEYKNKMDETKSWGSGEESKTTHALFLCITHNLLVIMEALLVDSGIENEKEKGRRACRRENAIKNGACFVATYVQRFTVRSLKFIRWLRNHCYQQLHWDDAKARLIEVYAKM